MKSLNVKISQLEVKKMLSRIVRGGRNEVTITEFIDLMSNMRSKGGVIETEKDMKEAFILCDSDNDGMIDAMDLLRAFEAAGETITKELASDLIRSGDSDLDGFINFSDFTKIMTQE